MLCIKSWYMCNVYAYMYVQQLYNITWNWNICKQYTYINIHSCICMIQFFCIVDCKFIESTIYSHSIECII